MVPEITMYEAQKKKMQGLCEEHDLVYRFVKDKYPIRFTIAPTAGVAQQLSMLEAADEMDYRSPNATLTWIFQDGALTMTARGGTFTISKTLRTKIESVLTKMISYWQQYFFRDLMERGALRPGIMPVISEQEDDEVPAGAIPLEELEIDDDARAELQDDDLGGIEDNDPRIIEATRIVRMENKATVALLQRRMNVGYVEAGALMDKLEELGVVGEYQGGSPREVLPADAPDDEEGAGNE